LNLIISILKKDILLIFRDKVGLALLFLMPIMLVLIMTLLQDSTFKALNQEKIKIIIVDDDKDIVGQTITEVLDSSKIFEITVLNEQKDSIDLQNAKNLVNKGKYKLALYIPQKTTRNLKKIISKEIKIQMPNLNSKTSKTNTNNNSEIEIFFDPVINSTFKTSIISSINEIVAKVQTQLVFKSYTKTIKKITGRENNNNFPINSITIKEKTVGKYSNQKLPTSTQHNVPAWTIFAIFFIVIPLSGQIIYEKIEGTLIRLKSTPVSYCFLLMSKVFVFTLIAVIQAFILIGIGVYILPLVNMPMLVIVNNYQLLNILIFTTFIGLAASGYSVLIGTIAKNQHQAAIFGSLSIVILAAIGGIWVPIYVMNDTMLIISKLSPLNWSINGYYNIFLRNENLLSVKFEIIKLLLMFVSTILISIYYNLKEKS
jgi:ABC-2 type transport system permease protein